MTRLLLACLLEPARPAAGSATCFLNLTYQVDAGVPPSVNDGHQGRGVPGCFGQCKPEQRLSHYPRWRAFAVSGKRDERLGTAVGGPHRRRERCVRRERRLRQSSAVRAGFERLQGHPSQNPERRITALRARRAIRWFLDGMPAPAGAVREATNCSMVSSNSTVRRLP